MAVVIFVPIYIRVRHGLLFQRGDAAQSVLLVGLGLHSRWSHLDFRHDDTTKFHDAAT